MKAKAAASSLNLRILFWVYLVWRLLWKLAEQRGVM
jgi:hypothetical protein